jgi:hypothetical protein
VEVRKTATLEDPMSRSTAPLNQLPGWPATSSPEQLHVAARAFGEGAIYVADVVRAVIEDLGDVVFLTRSGDYPFDWVGVDFPVGSDGAFIRVRSVDLEIRGCAVKIFDRHGVEAGGATFENLTEHLAAAVIVAEVTS